MTVVNFDGCAVGLVDRQGTPFLKKWRVATTNENLAKNLNECRCKHGTDFKHAPITGSNTSTTARYPEIMCEIVFSSLFLAMKPTSARLLLVVCSKPTTCFRRKRA